MPSSDSHITNRDNGIFRNWPLWLAVASQLATIAISWPLWQIRTDPPMLPAFSLALPQLDFGWMMVGSALIVLIRPWFGVWIHLAVILVSCVFDEMRIQPQFVSIWVLMLACVRSQLEPGVKWFLISMWIWAGVHKALSPDWFSHITSDLLNRISLDPQVWHWPFSIGIAAIEILIGIAAVVAPKKAAWLCPLMHFGIILFVSPLALNWNYSAIPWNLAIAILGFRILRNSQTSLPNKSWEYAAAGLLLLYPAGFYVGWVDHCFAFVFYSGNKPNGLISASNELRQIRGWTNINVPFPNERRLLRRHFEASAKPGDKLHIQDPRVWLDDQYFVLVENGKSQKITEEEFRTDVSFRTSHPVAKGTLLDDNVALWHLGRAGVKMFKRTENGMIYAVLIPPESYSNELIKLLKKIPNLEQLQLTGTDITDVVLRELEGNVSIEGIGLSNTRITNQSLPTLKSMRNLKYVEADGSQLDPELLSDQLN